MCLIHFVNFFETRYSASQQEGLEFTMKNSLILSISSLKLKVVVLVTYMTWMKFEIHLSRAEISAPTPSHYRIPISHERASIPPVRSNDPMDTAQPLLLNLPTFYMFTLLFTSFFPPHFFLSLSFAVFQMKLNIINIKLFVFLKN